MLAVHRYFWVSWVSAYLEIGRGYEVGVDRILDYHIPNPPSSTTFNAVYMSTEFNMGRWEFLKEQGQLLMQRIGLKFLLQSMNVQSISIVLATS